MDNLSRGIQNVGVFLLMCGALHAVTITPLPYKGNEPGYRIPRGTATFLDQEEGNRIRRQMLADRGSPGFWGGNEERNGYDYRRNYDNYDGNRYYGNEIDRDPYYEKKSRDILYYPNYNPEPSPSLRREHDCDPRRPYDNHGSSGYQGGRGYEGNDYKSFNYRGNGYDDRGYGGYNGGRGRRNGERTQFPQAYDRHRNGYSGGDQSSSRGGGYSGGEQWGGRNNGDINKFDNIGEGTVGFYGKVIRP